MLRGKGLGAVGLFGDSLKATFDLKLFVVPVIGIALGIIAAIIALVCCAPFIIIGIVSLGFLPAAIAFFAIAAAVFIAVIIISSAIIAGFCYKSVDECLRTKEISIEKNIQSAFGRWKTITGVLVMQSLVHLAVAAMALGPAAVLLIGYFIGISPKIAELSAANSSSAAALLPLLMPVITTAGTAVLALVLISFLVSPLLFLWLPAAALGNRPAFSAMSDGYSAGKAKYRRNLGAIFLAGIVGTLAFTARIFDPTVVIGFLLALWVELLSMVIAVKAYNEVA